MHLLQCLLEFEMRNWKNIKNAASCILHLMREKRVKSNYKTVLIQTYTAAIHN